MRSRRHSVEQVIEVKASPEIVWRHITEVDIAAFRHPPYLRLLDIPQPLHAELTRPGPGGTRTAFFARGHRFTQTITAWQPPHHYAFTFQASPGFRVGYRLDLTDGPFRMIAGAYRLTPCAAGVRLSLSSEYELAGFVGVCLYLPVRGVLRLFQRYLLRGIKANAERHLNGGRRA